MIHRSTLLLFTCIFLTTVFSGFAHAAEFDAVGSGLRMLWGLLIVLVIMFGLYAVLRKRVSAFQQQGKGVIKIIEIKHIPPRKTLMLVEVRGKEYLIGAGNDAINTIIPLQHGTAFSSVLEKTEEKLRS